MFSTSSSASVGLIGWLHFQNKAWCGHRWVRFTTKLLVRLIISCVTYMTQLT